MNIAIIFGKNFENYNIQDQSKIEEALEWAKKHWNLAFNMRRSLETAKILLLLNLDTDAIIASLFFFSFPQEIIQKRFGNNVSFLMEGVNQIAKIPAKNKTLAEREHIIKMFFAIAKDIRVIFIKLADSLSRLRLLEEETLEENKNIAQECIDICAPLADRLGVSWIKAELEDLSLKCLNNKAYKQIKDIVSLKKDERTEFLSQIEEEIKLAAKKLNISIEVSSRAKHFYSIYQKMKKRNKNAEDIFDLFGIRIFCNTVEECYSLLSEMHNLWKPLEGRFKDYIARPKKNGYKSLHTTVMTNKGESLEIQIRTHKMHRIAEYGVASHWLYKNNNVKDVSIVNRLKTWSEYENEDINFLEDIKRELLKDSIYVFTPQGKVIELPPGSTAIDFAYSIHSDIGDHCMAAKADGAIIPLSLKLKNTQVVEIITSINAHPHLKWLQVVKTSRARHRIRLWINEHDEKNIVIKKKIESQEYEIKEKTKERGERLARKPFELPLDSNSKKNIIKVENEKNMLVRFAKCCCPVTGDLITGYVSRGKGIIVHRKSCRNIKLIPDFAERQIEVEWTDSFAGNIRRFKVKAFSSCDIFPEIEGAISKFQGHIIEGRLEEKTKDRISVFFALHLESADDIKKITKSIRAIPGIISIQPL